MDTMNITPLEVTQENTMYFVTNREFHLSRDGKTLTKKDATIEIVNGKYEYSKIDEFGRRLFVKIITNIV